MILKKRDNRTRQFIYRVIDANFNRLREGLRVCEEFVRFASDDRALTQDFKAARNRVSKLYNKFSDSENFLFLSRDTARDVGRKGFPFEKERSGAIDVFWANLQRSKEATRVLEEFSKLLDKKFSDDFRTLRYNLYGFEKNAFEKLHKGLKKI